MGTWTAIFSVVHSIYGSHVHGSGRISGFLMYFIAADGSPRRNSFGLGNWTGLATLLIVVGLLAISSDFALRKLKARPWKRLQRLNYALFALVIAHAFFYGALLRTTSPFTFLLGLSVVAVLVGQAVGMWLWRRKYADCPDSRRGILASAATHRSRPHFLGYRPLVDIDDCWCRRSNGAGELMATATRNFYSRAIFPRLCSEF